MLITTKLAYLDDGDVVVPEGQSERVGFAAVFFCDFEVEQGRVFLEDAHDATHQFQTAH